MVSGSAAAPSTHRVSRLLRSSATQPAVSASGIGDGCREGGEERMLRAEAADLAHEVVSREAAEFLLQIYALFIVGNVEAERRDDGVDERDGRRAALRQLRRRPDEALVAAQFTQRLPAHPV